LKNNTKHTVLPQPYQVRSLEIAHASPIRLQTLDLARHAVTAPDGKHYVVATFDDTHVGNGYVTGIYPQQNGYLTLIRLTVCEFSSASPEEAIKRHLTLAQAIQQGHLDELKKSA
jgi:hypothetical protein